MAKGKSPATSSSGPGRKPKMKGKNHPRNLHKGFRSSGNTELIRAFLGKR